MPNRIKLLINQSGYDSGINCLIYQGNYSPVDEKELLIEVNEALASKRVLTQTDVKLVQRPDASSCFYVPHIFLEVPAPQVYFDGEPVNSENITLHPKEKMIRYNGQLDYPTNIEVTMDYQYLVTVVEDDYTQEQDGVTHHGNSVPTGLLPPKDITFKMDNITKELTITPIYEAGETTKFYHVRYLDTKRGRMSQPSPDKSISVTPNLYDLTWVLEVSKDWGNTWEEVSRKPITIQDFVLNDVDIITDEPHKPMDFTITPITSKAVEIRIKNPWYMWENNLRQAFPYRIKTIDTENQESEYRVFDKVGVNYMPTALKIRRKTDDGTASSYDGIDGFTLWEVDVQNVDTTSPEFVFIDDHLRAGKSYSYTFYLDDELSRRTPPFWKAITMPNEEPEE